MAKIFFYTEFIEVFLPRFCLHEQNLPEGPTD